MGSHRAGSGVRLGVYLGDMGSQTVAMQDLPAMTALESRELARLSVRILCAVVPLVFFNSACGEASTTKLALGILGRRRFHFLFIGDSDQGSTGGVGRLGPSAVPPTDEDCLIAAQPRWKCVMEMRSGIAAAMAFNDLSHRRHTLIDAQLKMGRNPKCLKLPEPG